MKIAGYFEAVIDALFAASFVADFKILKQVDRSKNGHLRGHMTFTDNSRFEFSEFVEQNADDEIQLVTYSYQWLDKNNTFIRRWDNTPHFPKLKNFPHYVHLTEDEVVAGNPINIFDLLEEIAKAIGSR